MAILRLQDGNQFSGYACALYSNSTSGGAVWRVYSYSSGTGTQIGSDVSFTWSTDTWYWCRFRVNGNNLYAKIWALGTDEPDSWTFTGSSSNWSSGVTAFRFGSLSSGGGVKSYAVFSVGTNGDSAPTAKYAPTPAGARLRLAAAGAARLDPASLALAAQAPVVQFGQFQNPFKDYPIQSGMPAGWHKFWGNAEVEIASDTSAAPWADRVLHITSCTISGEIWCDQTGVFADQEILTLSKWDSVSAGYAYAMGMVRHQGGMQNCSYQAGVRSDTTSGGTLARLYRATNDSNYQIGSDYSFSWSTGTWYWVRLRAEGTTISMKVWALGTAEPGSWNITATDSTYSTGWPVHRLNVEGPRIASFSVGANGLPAPWPTGWPPMLPAAATLALSGQTPAIGRGFVYQPATAALSLSAQAPIVTGVYAPTSASLGLSSSAPTLTLHRTAIPAGAALALSGPTPVALFSRIMVPPSASLAISGQQPTMVFRGEYAPVDGILALSGPAPTVGYHRKLLPDTAAINVTANAPAISIERLPVAPGAGVLSLAPSDLSIRLDRFIIPGVGALNLSAVAPGTGQYMMPSPASIALYGELPTLEWQVRYLVPDPASLVLTNTPPRIGGRRAHSFGAIF